MESSKGAEPAQVMAMDLDLEIYFAEDIIELNKNKFSKGDVNIFSNLPTYPIFTYLLKALLSLTT